MYLHLFHGRDHLDASLDDWGFDGPVLKIDGYHVTYGDHVRVRPRCGGPDDWHDWFDLAFVGDCLFYDGKLYGDYSVFVDTDDEQAARAVDFVPEKATLTLEARARLQPPAPAKEDLKFYVDEDDTPVVTFEVLADLVLDMADVMEAHDVHGDANLKLWYLKARHILGDLPEEFIPVLKAEEAKYVR